MRFNTCRLFLKSINTLKPYIEPDYAYESPRTFSEREAAARMLAKHGVELPEEPTVLDEVVAGLKSGLNEVAGVGHGVADQVGGAVTLVGFGTVCVCGSAWLMCRSDDSTVDDSSRGRPRSRGKGKKPKTKRF